MLCRTLPFRFGNESSVFKNRFSENKSHKNDKILTASYPFKRLKRDRIVVEEISVSSQLSCKPQKNVSQHLKMEWIKYSNSS